VDEPDTPSGPVPYAVLPGDNFTTIANKHGITVKAISAANPGVDSRHLKVGQKLNLPANVRAVPPAIPDDTPDTGTANEVLHTVVSGDTLSKLSRDYKVSIKAIQRANGIRGSTIYVGQKLIIPAGSSSGQ
jgi:N-acetylmuramoyl-L-alanine amidase